MSDESEEQARKKEKKRLKEQRRKLRKREQCASEETAPAPSVSLSASEPATTTKKRARETDSSYDDHAETSANKKRHAATSGSCPAAPNAATWNFEVDYNDHFETPRQAYADLVPWLDAVCAARGKTRAQLRIYDPYFCQGQMKQYLAELGFPLVINENRDFYEDIRRKKLPEYDVLVTNPPYSGEHKTKLLQFLQQRRRDENTHEFALLLPVYTITKSYWKDYINFCQTKYSSMYVLPPDYYEYCHPEGTGKDIPPFYSSWILGGMTAEVKQASSRMFQASPRRALQATPAGVKRIPFQTLTAVDKIETVAALGLVAEKRPNPKQRKKLQLSKAKGK